MWIRMIDKLTSWGIIFLLAISVGYGCHIILDYIKSKTELNRANVDFLARSSVNLGYNPYKYHGEY